MKHILLSIVFLTFLVLSLSACGTMEGAGRDIEGAGESIQKSAQ
jgi:predicted small secreted protein